MKARMLVGTLVLALAVPFTAVAQDAGSPPSLVRGPAVDYLTDDAGRSVYLYLRDGQGESSCYEICAENWPPVLVEGEPVPGEGVVEGMLSTVTRTDGSTQLAYNSWPLYYHARDTEPGEAYGHRLGEIFYLISSSGARIEAAVEDEIADAFSEDTDAEDAPTEDTAEAEADEAGEPIDVATGPGANLYAANCAVCHGPEGEGVVGPGLAGNPSMARADYVVTTILFGRPDHGMPPFADTLSDEEIAQITTFVRGSWGNDYSAVEPGDVAELR